jgi:cysteine-rich repeat protein
MLKRDWIFGILVLLFFIYFSTLTNLSISLSPPTFSDDYIKDLSANPTISSYAKVSWDGSTNYVRSGEGTGFYDGTFTSKLISPGAFSFLKVSWIGSSDVTVQVSTNNWVSSCYAVNGQYISDSGCPLPASSFKYRVKLPSTSLPSKIDKILFDFNSPITCGNNIIEGNEQCDGSSLNGQSCSSLGFASGALSCIAPGLTNQCKFDTSSCVPAVCGNGIIETGESCDDLNANSGDGCSNICKVESGWKCSGQPSRCLRFKSGAGVVENQIGIQCSDGKDNDNDGAMDLNDFSCSSASDADETNPKSQCQNGIDDDGNGFVDFPFDTGCDSNQDNEEFGGSSAGICGNGIIETGESCDDLNANSGDGCSPSCGVESGYTCSGEPSACTANNVNLECPVGYCLPRDSQGWTVYTPSADSKFVYVSNVGNDNTCRAYTLAEVGDPYNPSGSIVPCSTINVSLSKLRTNMPDWMLLKRGDTWNKPLGEANLNNAYHYPFYKSGRSYSEPFVVTTYGSSNKRPVLNTGKHINAVELSSSSGEFLAINGIDFISNGTGVDGAEGFFNGWGGNNMLIEDCRFEGYFHGVANYGNTNNLTIRRNQFLDSWSISSGTWAQGSYAANTHNLLYQENVNDRNGWNPEIPYHDLVLLPNRTISEWAAVTNGKFNISFYNLTDSNWVTQVIDYSISGLDFSSVTSLNDVASKIQNAINAKVGYNLVNVTSFYYKENGETYFLFAPYNKTANHPAAIWVRPYSGSASGGTDISGSVYYGNLVGYLNGPGGFAGGNTRAHGVYMSYNAGNKNLYFLNNIISRASAHGIFFSDAGVARGNLLIRDPVPIITSATGNIVEDNVILETEDIIRPAFNGDLRAQPRGFGILAAEGQYDSTTGQYYTGPLVYRNNILANPIGTGNINALAFRQSNSAPPTTITIQGNIIYNWMVPSGSVGYYSNEGIGLFVQDRNSWNDTVTIKDNIFQQPLGHSSGSALVWFNPSSVDSNHFTFRNNTYYMTGSSNWFFVGDAFKTFAQWVSLSGETNAVNQQLNFVDPTRSVSTYSALLGKPATFDAFINEARSQSKYNWRNEYTAPVVNQYIRDGFAIGGGICGPLGCSPGEASKNDGTWLDMLRGFLRRIFGID